MMQSLLYWPGKLRDILTHLRIFLDSSPFAHADIPSAKTGSDHHWESDPGSWQGWQGATGRGRFPVGSYCLDAVWRWPSEIPFCVWWFLMGLAGHSFAVDGGSAFQVLIGNIGGTPEVVVEFFVSESKDPVNLVQPRIKLHQSKSWVLKATNSRLPHDSAFNHFCVRLGTWTPRPWSCSQSRWPLLQSRGSGRSEWKQPKTTMRK